jgi:Ribose/xylose/arabinose/galactoside ABC-type transport systems, permease components
MKSRFLPFSRLNILIWLGFMLVCLSGQFRLHTDFLLRQFLTMGFMTCGLSLEMLTGDLDLSFAAQISASTFLAAYLLEHSFLWTAAAAMLLFNISVGAVKGYLLAKLEIPSIILTFAFQVILGNAFFWLSNNRSIVPNYLTENHYPAFLIVTFIAFVLAVLLLEILLNHTYWGKYCRMIGEDRHVVRDSGVPYIQTEMIIHIFSALFFTAAGILLFLTVSGPSETGNGFLFQVIAAACLGGIDFRNGRGQIPGMLVGTVSIILLVQLLTCFGLLNSLEIVCEGAIILFSIISNGKKQKN